MSRDCFLPGSGGFEVADPHIRAAFYLSPTLDSGWRWSGDGEVLTWSSGKTIAFRQEVEAVLRRLAPEGLPPFGAVALVLSACRENWLESAERQTIVDHAGVFAGMGIGGLGTEKVKGAQLVFRRVIREIDDLVQGLDAVAALPAHLREGVEAKALLAEVVFEQQPNRMSSDDSSLIITALDEGVHPDTLRPRLCSEQSLSQFATEVEGLAPGLKRVNADVLARRAKTGIDAPVKPVSENLAPPLLARQLISSLRNDPTLGGVARLAADLMAAVSVPRRLHARDELPMGGVSDLSNRGSFDRLLVSELAHDDLTLAVRVAMNEALYLRREAPPRQPPNRRAILIDTGIRMWGVPRVFATAVALAMVATHDHRAELGVHSTTIKGIEKVDLTSKVGLEAHLARLQPAPHPGLSLQAFEKTLEELPGIDTDAILITHPDALEDPEFLHAFRSIEHQSIYVATVDLDGSFRLLVLSKGGQKPVREAKLSLDQILNGEARTVEEPASLVPIAMPAGQSELPALFYLEHFPFFLPHQAKPSRTLVTENHGMLSVTHDGRLLRWLGENHGAEQLTAELPGGELHLLAFEDLDNVVRVVVGSRKTSKLEMATFNLETRKFQKAVLDINRQKPQHVFSWKGIVYVVTPDLLFAFEPVSSSTLATVKMPIGMKWVRSRFFRDHRGTFTVHYEGSDHLKFERASGFCFGLPFERQGSEGIWSITKGVAIYDPDKRLQFAFQGSLLGISTDGNSIAFWKDGKNYLWSLLKKEKPRVIGKKWLEEMLAPQINASLRCSWSSRHDVYGVSFTANNQLLFQTGHSTFVTIEALPSGNLFIAQHAPTELENVLRFTETAPQPRSRIDLAAATFKDGSRVWRDGRGLIHLRSSDPLIPEFSLALTNVAVAAWASNGKITGPAFLVGSRSNEDGAYFLNLIRRFVSKVREWSSLH